MLKVAIIADDITGAADTGVQFCQVAPPVLLAGAACRDWPRNSPGSIALNTTSRHLTQAQAVKAVNIAVQGLKPCAPGLIYKKIDSCMRGNVGVETEATLQALDLLAAFVAPAFPAQGRSTRHDIHYVNDVPVAETETGRDPVTPVKYSSLSKILADQAQLPVGHVDISKYEQGQEALAAHVSGLLRKGCRIIAFDALAQSDLDAIVELTRTFSRTLLVGSAGLAKSLADFMSRTYNGPLQPLTDLPEINGHFLLVCGSASAVLAGQVQALLAKCGGLDLSLDAMALTTQGQGYLEQKADQINKGLENGLVAVRMLPPDANGPKADSDKVVACLGDLVSLAAARKAPGALFLSGGDTALAVLTKLGATCLELKKEVISGLIAGQLLNGSLVRLPVFTKSGGFGDRDALVELYKGLYPDNCPG